MNRFHSHLQVGVTGGIGAGKSVACKIFRILGIPVYNADNRARWLCVNNSDLKTHIIKTFGEDAYDTDGNFDRSFMARHVFNDESKLEKLNSLIHPVVKKDFINWQSKQTSPYTIKEAALLFEAGTYIDLDIIITVTAPDEDRVNRVILRDPHRNQEDVQKIMQKQMEQEEKARQSHYVILNDNKHLITRQIIDIHNKIKTATK